MGSGVADGSGILPADEFASKSEGSGEDPRDSARPRDERQGISLAMGPGKDLDICRHRVARKVDLDVTVPIRKLEEIINSMERA